jgi:lysophospholipase L1-like esterase
LSYRTQHVNRVLLLSIFLSSCANHSQPTKTPTVSLTLTATPIQTVFYLDSTALSYGIFETDAVSLAVDVYNTTPDGLNPSADISIEDPSGVKTYKLQTGESTVVHAMPVGEKQVTITGGGQSYRNGEIRGVFINTITFNGSAVRIEEPYKRLVVYGDSLAAGGSVDNPSAEAWPVLLRKHYSVMVEAYGYRALYDDASTSVKRAELLSKISASTPDFIWLAIGTNDHTLGQWSAQEFGEAYASTLDAIHASNSQAVVFAQSPILQANESTNLLGEDLESYRQQIADACLARPAWCIFVDGKDSAFPQPDELDKDGVHLTTESSAKYAEAVLNILKLYK